MKNITREQVKAVLATKGLEAGNNYKAERKTADLIIEMGTLTANLKQREDAAPDWAKNVTVDGLNVPVSAKVAAEGLEVESWTSKKGAEMHRVHWMSGTTTKYSGSLDRVYVEYDR